MAERIDTASNRELPTPTYLRERLRYEPETGKLFWREHPRMSGYWNRRFAGEEALTAKSQWGYRQGKVDSRNHRAHRLIWAMYYGEWPVGFLDHINHIKDDNRISNLRVVSPLENSKNQPMHPCNTSGVAGVYWAKQARKWYSQIKIGGRNRHLGMFDTIEAAAAARKQAQQEHGYHESHGEPLYVA